MNILIYNPLARGNRGSHSLQEAIKNLAIKNYKIFSILDLKNNLVETLAKYPAEFKVILIGGDGTLNQFLNRYKNANFKQKILFYSGGTGNDFQKNFHTDKKQKHYLLDLSEKINKLKVELEELTFDCINAIGAGIDGLIVKMYNDSKKIRKFTYTLQTIKAFFKYKPAKVKLILDDEEFVFEKCWLVSVNNGMYFGSGMKIAPMALVDDGLLDVCVINAPNKLFLIRNFLSVFRGKHLKLKKYVFYRQAKKIQYISNSEQYVQYDGELVKNMTNSFKVEIE